ncbi:hypothetical protein EYF80_050975 [Liparis tanakae]|uniref:Uncharacterized protein n=1 Tax=Liparis tanakae TaxID=230148 RepID=A0A4Z2FC80_9TELE|nr:hypothetical protein EYF80_050975 [Liparis tanakae]
MLRSTPQARRLLSRGFLEPILLKPGREEPRPYVPREQKNRELKRSSGGRALPILHCQYYHQGSRYQGGEGGRGGVIQTEYVFICVPPTLSRPTQEGKRSPKLVDPVSLAEGRQEQIGPARRN